MEQINTKYIFVTGGVISGLGKGVCTASVGNILKAAGFNVFLMKLDPYLNANPGIISPLEHGEVFVTNDGLETDLDLGYYERFTNVNLTKDSSYSAGKLYQRLWNAESNGELRGRTMQMIPHFTNEIQKAILNAEKNNSNIDFVLIEIGGTVGDYESNPFFYAIDQFKRANPDRVMFIHNSYVPYLEASNEFKTKPTQHSIATLRSLGINPDMVFLRSHRKINEDILNKIAYQLFLPEDTIIGIHDFKNIYELPLYLEKNKVVKTICKKFKLRYSKPELEAWKEFVNRSKTKKDKLIKIAMCGKYVDFLDAYKSIIEALKIAAVYEEVELSLDWINIFVNDIDDVKKRILNSDAVVLLPGKSSILNDWITMKDIAKLARINRIPTLGIDWGFHSMLAEYLQTINDKNESYEVRKYYTDEDQNSLIFITQKVDKFNEIKFKIRLGDRKILIKDNSKAYDIYNQQIIYERHKHKYLFLTQNIQKILHNANDNNLIISGTNANNEIIEIIELKDHPFYIGVQYQPQYKVRPLSPGKLFTYFLKTIKDRK